MEKTTVGLLVATLVAVLFFGFTSPKVVVAPQIDNQQPVGQVSTGDGYVITKKLAYSELLTTGVAISNAVQGGRMVLDDVIVRTGVLQIASGTLFQIYTSGNTYGTSTNVLSASIAAIPAATTITMDDGASSTVKTMLDDGAKLMAKCTGAACKATTVGNTTEGYMTITMVFKKADRQAYIYE
jgi:hypothetical protein